MDGHSSYKKILRLLSGMKNCVSRPPLSVQLHKGWNKVLLKLPVGKFTLPEVRLVKWMFTVVFVTLDGEKGSGRIDLFARQEIRVNCLYLSSLSYPCLSCYTDFISTFTYTLTPALCISLFIGDRAWWKQIIKWCRQICLHHS